MTAPELRDLWLSEMWPTCPEVSRGERARKRKEDRDLTAALSVHAESTGCAQNALSEAS